MARPEILCHNIVDPFEDTESWSPCNTAPSPAGHNIVDPFEDTERSASTPLAEDVIISHNIVDPFEDTERWLIRVYNDDPGESQHRRSVRGY